MADTPEQAAAREWLGTEEAMALIKGAVTRRVEGKFETIAANSVLSEAAKERLADAAIESSLEMMRLLMRGAAQAHVLGGADAARQYLAFVGPLVAAGPPRGPESLR